MRGHAEDLGIPNLDNRIAGDGRGILGASRHPTGVQRSVSGRDTKAGEAVRTLNRVLQRKPGERRGPVAQVSPRSGYAGGAEQKFLVDSDRFHRHSWLESTEADTPNHIRLRDPTENLESTTVNRFRMD
jgi:hypothetical protein